MTGKRAWLFLLAVPPLLWAGNALVGRSVISLLSPIELAFWRWRSCFPSPCAACWNIGLCWWGDGGR